MKSDWWVQNRKGEKANVVGQRETNLKARGKNYYDEQIEEDDE